MSAYQLQREKVDEGVRCALESQSIRADMYMFAQKRSEWRRITCSHEVNAGHDLENAVCEGEDLWMGH